MGMQLDGIITETDTAFLTSGSAMLARIVSMQAASSQTEPGRVEKALDIADPPRPGAQVKRWGGLITGWSLQTYEDATTR